MGTWTLWLWGLCHNQHASDASNELTLWEVKNRAPAPRRPKPPKLVPTKTRLPTMRIRVWACRSLKRASLEILVCRILLLFCGNIEIRNSLPRRVRCPRPTSTYVQRRLQARVQEGPAPRACALKERSIRKASTAAN